MSDRNLAYDILFRHKTLSNGGIAGGLNGSYSSQDVTVASRGVVGSIKKINNNNDKINSRKFEAERLEAAKERRRRQKERAASLSSSSQTSVCPKCSRVCASRIRLYSHQPAINFPKNPRLRGISHHRHGAWQLIGAFRRNLEIAAWSLPLP